MMVWAGAILRYSEKTLLTRRLSGLIGAGSLLLQTPQKCRSSPRRNQGFPWLMKEFAESDISFVWALKGLHVKQLLVEHLLKEDMKYRDFLLGQGSPS